MFEDYVERSMTYGEYITLIDDLLLKGRTTGPNQSKAMINYTAINRQRIHRLEKTIDLDESVESASRGAQRRVIWLVITEGWCGDAAQNIPVIEKIAAQSVNIETRYILRDENPDLNGASRRPCQSPRDRTTDDSTGDAMPNVPPIQPFLFRFGQVTARWRPLGYLCLRKYTI